MIVHWSREWNLNWDIVAGLVSHETAWLQSRIFREKKNPGGHGAENDDPFNKATTFASYEEGVRAVVAHLAGYVYGAGSWTQYSSRYAIVESKGWAGTVSELWHLEQKWAYSEPARYAQTPLEARYGAQLARHANDLLRFVPIGELEPAVRLVPKPMMTSRLSPNKDGYSTPRIVEAIVQHIATGTLKSNLDWLTRAGSGASCNAYITKAGEIIEMVPFESSAWTNGVVKRPDLSNALVAEWVRRGINPNTRTYTIEHEGNPQDDLTPAQLDANNRLCAWVASKGGFPLTRKTMLGHYQIDSVDRPYCPSFKESEWQQLVDGARRLLLNAPGDETYGAPRDENALYVLDCPFAIRAGFRALFESQGKAKFPPDPIAGALSLFGLPLEEEQATEYGAKQEFERCIFRWERGANAPWDLVCQHRLPVPA